MTAPMHALKSAGKRLDKGRPVGKHRFVSACGEEREQPLLPEDLTAWGSDVTCQPCLETRYGATHAPG